MQRVGRPNVARCGRRSGLRERHVDDATNGRVGHRSLGSFALPVVSRLSILRVRE
jgi:hypothetical protein